VPNIRVVEISNDDAWVRDTGPTFVINDQGEVRGVDWGFNAWGGFDGGLYAPWNRDEELAAKVMEMERCSVTTPKVSCLKAARSTSTAKAP
jgi:agmatine deiminase